MSSITFYFDYISPYAYLAWTRIQALAAAHDRTVTPVPVLFAALLDFHGQKGPAEIPAKRRYVAVDIARSAALLGVPISPPPTHPFNPLLALRVSGLPMAQQTRALLVDRLFKATWAGGPGVTDPAVVGAIASELGVDEPDSGPTALEQAVTPIAKQHLRDQSAAAIAAGVFGVPTIVADGELFWGLDSLSHLARFLKGETLFDQAFFDSWAETTPSASRS